MADPDRRNEHERQVSRQRRLVLTEEEYESTLSSIVQRHYFPDLTLLEQQAAILQRPSVGDDVGTIAIGRATRKLEEREKSIAEIEAEDEIDLDSNHLRKRARPLNQETITGFHARVTTEDDNEFDSKQRQEVIVNRKRLEKIFHPKEKKQNKDIFLEYAPASDQFNPRPYAIQVSSSGRPPVRNSLFFNPTPLRNPNGEIPSHSTKLLHPRDESDDVIYGAKEPPQPNNHRSSSLVPSPIERNRTANPLTTILSSSSTTTNEVPRSSAKHQLVEYVPKHASEKKIDPTQTRFPQRSRTPSIRPLLDQAYDALYFSTDGATSDASTDLDETPRPISEERKHYLTARKRVHQACMKRTPLLVPGPESGARHNSTSMTRGKVDSTPATLSGGEQTVRQRMERAAYSIPSESGRDQAVRMAEKKLAHRVRRAKSTGRKKKSRKEPLSPAAQSLLLGSSSVVSTRARNSFSSSLRSSYTPKSTARSTSTRRTGDSAHNATPLASRFH